jgi:hypothetical protein
MRDDWKLCARGAEAADAILWATFGIDVRKALNPLKLRDFQTIVRTLASSLKDQVVPVEDVALKQALGKLDARWTDMGAEARAKVINEAARYLGPPVVAKVLPRIDQTLAFAQKDIVPATKKNAVLTYDLHISPDLNATDERIANYVRVSQGHFITNKYGERMDAFAGQARGIVAGGLEKGWGSADIADQLYGELSKHTDRGLGYWNTIAMVYANRARTMTQLAAYHEAGIEAYVWESVLDEATSVQCRFLHGQRFPVANAMQRFQQVEDAESPEAIKTLQPFVSLGRDGERDALVFGSGESRQVVAHVGEDASGKKDETGSFENAMDGSALQAAGITAPPIHGNCRSTIIPEFGGGGGGGGRGRGGGGPGPGPGPPPPLPQPERLTPGARKAQALEDLHALPTAKDGHADTSSLFTFHADPPFLEHPMFAGDDAGGALGAQWQVNATNRRPQLDDLILTKPTVDRGVVDKLIQKPKALGAAPVPKVVQYEGKLYVIDGHEQLLAQKLLGQKTANCTFVNLDKRLKVPPLVHPIEPGPAPLPPTLIKPAPHPPPPPKKKVDIVPPPPPPRLWMKQPVIAPDPIAMQHKVAAAAKKDATILAGSTGDDRARLELAARKKLKGVARSKEEIVVPFAIKDGDRVEHPYELLNRMGLGGREGAQAAALPQRVLLDDYIASADRCYRSSTERAISELVDHGGVYRMPGEDDPYRDGPPILIRMGNKLYPHLGGRADPQMTAAKALGFKTLDARVIDVNPKLAELIAADNAAIFPKQAERDLEHAAEVHRVQKAAEERAHREGLGSPDVVAVRAKHQPADYAAKFQEQYNEAAPSLGWGHAMQERGLDFPAEHLRRLASQFEQVKDHPFQGMAALLRSELPTGQTVRGYLRVVEGQGPGQGGAIARGRELATAKSLKVASAILAHVDGIQGQSDFKISMFSPKCGSKPHFKQRFKWLAELTDRSVSTPEIINVTFAKDGRASCDSEGMTSWRTRHAVLELKKDEATRTVFHELGHAIEGADRGRGIRASAFLDARTAGEEGKALSAMTGNSSYRPDEVARPDKFVNPYIGKFYGREVKNTDKWRDAYYGPKALQKGADGTDQVHRATEVTSMAVEQLASGTFNTAFAGDPDHFLFGLGQLGGY